MAFGIDDAIAAGLSIIDKFVPDPEMKVKATSELRQLIATGRAAQVDLNKAEVQSGHWLGKWRGALGWACVAAVIWQFILYPFLVAILLAFDRLYPVEKLPVLDLKYLGSILFGMLGLGGGE